MVIVGDKNLSKVKPYLGDRYYEFNYRLIWWPRETYKGLTWQRIRDGIKDPVQRGQFWDVVLHRQIHDARLRNGIRCTASACSCARTSPPRCGTGACPPAPWRSATHAASR